ncbi:hypothetical protein M758_12G037700 [Ceratodon purpureus]|nr:hypothetical protein M758_12G037700 [Ceratodon purpureus]
MATVIQVNCGERRLEGSRRSLAPYTAACFSHRLHSAESISVHSRHLNPGIRDSSAHRCWHQASPPQRHSIANPCSQPNSAPNNTCINPNCTSGLPLQSSRLK